MKILVTGAAGFIGFHTSLKLLERGDELLGLDNLNDYYDPQLKIDRLKLLLESKNFKFEKLDIADQEEVAQYFNSEKPQTVIHLAAQAGVRYSIKNPYAYVNSNLVGFINILEGCRHNDVEHLVYASSSSVYGSNRILPFSVEDSVDHPVSLYAATKKANELMAHTYSHLYKLPTTGLRFFTVYGPWGRPDMALFLFTKSILDDKPIDIFNYGNMKRDFTYIDDVVEGVIRVLDNVPQPSPELSKIDRVLTPAESDAPYKVYNIGNHSPVDLLYFIEILERSLGKEAKKNLLPMQPEDVLSTYADVNALIRDVGFEPSTPIEAGIEKFVHWYKEYYRIPDELHAAKRSVAA